MECVVLATDWTCFMLISHVTSAAAHRERACFEVFWWGIHCFSSRPHGRRMFTSRRQRLPETGLSTTSWEVSASSEFSPWNKNHTAVWVCQRIPPGYYGANIEGAFKPCGILFYLLEIQCEINPDPSSGRAEMEHAFSHSGIILFLILLQMYMDTCVSHTAAFCIHTLGLLAMKSVLICSWTWTVHYPMTLLLKLK